MLTLLIQALRNIPTTASVWKRIPDGWRWLVPIVMGDAIGFVEAYRQGHDVHTALLAMMSIGLGAVGLNGVLTDSSIPWNGRAGGHDPGTEAKRG
jgi:hypothetical protein